MKKKYFPKSIVMKFVILSAAEKFNCGGSTFLFLIFNLYFTTSNFRDWFLNNTYDRHWSSSVKKIKLWRGSHSSLESKYWKKLWNHTNRIFQQLTVVYTASRMNQKKGRSAGDFFFFPKCDGFGWHENLFWEKLKIAKIGKNCSRQ